MPIIDFPFSTTADALAGRLGARAQVIALETVDGRNEAKGDLYRAIDVTSNLYSTITIDGESFVGASVPSVGSVTATLTTLTFLSKTFTATSVFDALLYYSEGRALLPSIVGYGVGTDLLDPDQPPITFNQHIGYLPALMSAGEISYFVPPELSGGYALLTGLTASGLMTDPTIGEGYLPALVSQGWAVQTRPPSPWLKARIQARVDLTNRTIIRIDGHRYSARYITQSITARGRLIPYISINGNTTLFADLAGRLTFTGRAKASRRISALLQSEGVMVGTLINGVPPPSVWVGRGWAAGDIGPLWSFAETGSRLEVSMLSYLGLYGGILPIGTYGATFNSTVTFTDHFISQLAAAIYEELLDTQAIALSSVFTPLVDGVVTTTSTMTLTSQMAAFNLYISQFLSSLNITGAFTSSHLYLAQFASTLTVTDIYTVIKEVLTEFLSTLSLEDTYSALAQLQAFVNSTLRLESLLTPSVGDTAAPLSAETATWVVDVDTKASVQYSHFGFNAYAKHGTQYIGAADDGLYLLDGDTDEGANIDAFVQLAISRFETAQRKYFPSIYLGVSSTGRMLVRAEVDGQSWVYEANNTSADFVNQRVDLGRGLVGSHWQFTILNQDGLDFDLESVEFLPLISSRRVY